jgi:hypothetical protein
MEGRTMLRFAIRDVFWLTLVVALIVTWRTDLARQQSEFHDVLRNQFVGDLDEAKSLIAKAKKHDPLLFSEFKAINASERQYLQQRRSLLGQYRAFFSPRLKSCQTVPDTQAQSKCFDSRFASC